MTQFLLRLSILMFLNIVTFDLTFGMSGLKQAESFYDRQDFQSATDLYQKLILNHGDHSFLFHNLASAHYRLHNKPEALAAFMKAHSLDPRNEETNRSLKILVADLKLVEPQKSAALGLDDSLINRVCVWMPWCSLGELQQLAAWVWWIFILACLAQATRPSSLGRLTLGVSLSIWLVLISSITFKTTSSHKWGVIKTKTANLYTSPGRHNQPIHEAHMGHPFVVLKEQDNWMSVKIIGGGFGWLANDQAISYN